MKNESLHQETEPNQGGFEEQNMDDDDLKFMRSVVEKTSRQVKPDVHIIIVSGLMCMTCYTAIYCLTSLQLGKWIWPAYLSVMAIGLTYILVSLVRIAKREKKAGFISRIKQQVTWIWIIITLHGLAWSILGMLLNNFSAGGDPGFLWAMLFSIALCITGILHSKEWLFGGIGIFAGMLLTFFIHDYGYLILGLATGLGCIIPAIIIRKNFKKQEKENEKA
jgi:magnesium-transporting ATPase (P-type)